MASHVAATIGWRTSSYSQGNGTCVEVADLPDGRNSTTPHGPTVVFTRAEMHAWIKGCKAGKFDDLT